MFSSVSFFLPWYLYFLWSILYEEIKVQSLWTHNFLRSKGGIHAIVHGSRLKNWQNQCRIFQSGWPMLRATVPKVGAMAPKGPWSPFAGATGARTFQRQYANFLNEIILYSFILYSFSDVSKIQADAISITWDSVIMAQLNRRRWRKHIGVNCEHLPSIPNALGTRAQNCGKPDSQPVCRTHTPPSIAGELL